MNDESAAITGTTSGIRTLADDTLRITVDVEPRHAAEAARLFLERGTAVALARLSAGAEPKRTRLSSNCAVYCRDEKFRRWLADKEYGSRPATELGEVGAAYIVRRNCGIGSRSELDTNEEAAQSWIALRKQYHEEIGDD